MSSIKTKILVSISLIILISVTVIGGLAVYETYQSTMSSLKVSMVGSAQLAAQNVKDNINSYQLIISEIASNAILTNPEATIEDIQAFLDEKCKLYGFEYIGFVDESGYDRNNKTQISAQAFYSEVLKGKNYISEPIKWNALSDMTIVAAAPVKQNNVVKGLIYLKINAGMLSDITNQIKISNTNRAYMIGSSGNIIAHWNPEYINKKVKTSDLMKNDPSLQQLVALEEKLLAGETGYGFCSYDGVDQIAAYAPVDDNLGWGVVVIAEKAEFMEGLNQGIKIILAVMVLAVVCAYFIAGRLANNISKPLVKLMDRMKLMAEGDLKTPVEVAKGKDEVAVLGRSFAEAVEMLNSYVSEISSDLAEMAEGNLAVDTTHNFKGDFKIIGDSIMIIADALNNSFREIQRAADQVADGAAQVAGGAQALSQGATEQASSIEELSATITEISEHVKENATFTTSAHQQMGMVSSQLYTGNEKMEEMVKAMKVINESSTKIARIIKTIDDIAFQTNILALNAAVEAARAGMAGKGFAVVSDEVRNLAAKSAEAAKETTALIQNAVDAVNQGTRIADDTKKAIDAVVNGAKEINTFMDKISEATNEQAVALSQITQGLDQISSVVQTNSATAEESAAASEELSGQAQILKGLLAQFKIKDEDEEERLMPDISEGNLTGDSALDDADLSYTADDGLTEVPADDSADKTFESSDDYAAADFDYKKLGNDLDDGLPLNL